MVRLTDRPDMTLDVCRGRKTTTQQQQILNSSKDLDLFYKMGLDFFIVLEEKICLTTTEIQYRIYLAIRWGLLLSRITTNSKISSLKFCYITIFTLPKLSQASRSIL